MKTWKHWIIVTVLAVLGIVVAFSGCDNGNNDPVLCDCLNGTIYYDEECSCDASNCNCISEYKPAFETMFAFLNGEDEQQDQAQNAYNAIWTTTPQLIVKLKNSVIIKESVISIIYAADNDPRIEFASVNGRIRVYGEMTNADFIVAFETVLEDCVAFYLQE